MTNPISEPTRTNWLLVLRHLIPAVYVPILAMIAFGILVAITGAGGFEHIEETGYVFTGSSFVLVFARLASLDLRAARRNVTALGGICLLVLGVLVGVGGGWQDERFWGGITVTAVILAIAAVIGLRWARRWAAWRAARDGHTRLEPDIDDELHVAGANLVNP